MDEVWLRVGLVAGALIVAAVATLALRSRTSGKPRTLRGTGLRPGVYLFTSAACPGCGAARRALQDTTGEDGFVELSWEQEPGTFDRLGVDAVPATMLVRADGSATLWPGRPDDALGGLGP